MQNYVLFLKSKTVRKTSDLQTLLSLLLFAHTYRYNLLWSLLLQQQWKGLDVINVKLQNMPKGYYTNDINLLLRYLKCVALQM